MPSEYLELPFECTGNNDRYVIHSPSDDYVRYYCFEKIGDDTFKHVCPYIMATKDGKVVFKTSITQYGEKCILSYYDENGNAHYLSDWENFDEKTHNNALKEGTPTSGAP